ncbi:uncharacterized protein LOC141910640 isoform X2 [Tubulanus polymorphus]|uniref:uncharacterized protein LOC141910640 isoform X2 n=1 Tax=Tubulanus polymorphus TaxID=672921 RepID=UPI003DA23CA1
MSSQQPPTYAYATSEPTASPEESDSYLAPPSEMKGQQPPPGYTGQPAPPPGYQPAPPHGYQTAPSPGYQTGPPPGYQVPPPPPGYAGQFTAHQMYPHSTMIVTQPQILSNPPNDHLALAIYLLICCCWPLGIVAVIKSMDVRSAVSCGDRDKAAKLSKETWKWCMATLGVGIAVNIIVIVAISVYIAVIVKHATDTFDRHINGQY